MNEFKNIDELVYLGPEGTYSQMAAELFVEQNNLSHLKTANIRSIKAIVDYADKNENKIAIVPIENSIEGIVRETIDNLTFATDERLKIVAELVLPVNNCLLATTPIAVENIKNIISHPQALAQCRNYISQKFPTQPHLIEANSTAEAARQLGSRDSSYAAIANKKAAEMYNLNILDENINDDPNNRTRFVVLAKQDTLPTGNDKTSIIFSTKNVAGALADVINIFKKHNINLSYIDSRPSKKNLKEYNFYIDFDGHVKEEKIRTALDEMSQYINFYRHNGSYKKF